MKRIALLTLVSIGTLTGCAEKAQNEGVSPAAAPSFVRTAEQKSSDAVPVPPAMRGVPLETGKRRPPTLTDRGDGPSPGDAPERLGVPKVAFLMK